MADFRAPRPACLIVGLLWSSERLLEIAERRLSLDCGEVAARSETIPFDASGYYAEEMGTPLWRKWFCFRPLFPPDRLPAAKRLSNQIEEWLRRQKNDGDAARGRPVNLDPGYLDSSKVVLASAKSFSHRIVLRDGVHAETTLIIEGKSDWRAAGAWTYEDYRSPAASDFFRRARDYYLERMREWPTSS